MAIEDIFKALEEQADVECAQVLESAREQAKAIEEDAKAEAERIKAHKIDQVRASVESRAARVTNAARFENRKDIAAVKDAAIESVYAGALDKLAQLRSNSSYKTLFTALVEEALAGLEGPVTIQVDPADAKLAADVAATAGVDATIDTSAGVSGGVTVIAAEGRVYRRNTFEDRMAKIRKIKQAEISEILFS
jgi:vacuolar-type H+-ATPase subunit E/Vma4